MPYHEDILSKSDKTLCSTFISFSSHIDASGWYVTKDSVYIHTILNVRFQDMVIGDAGVVILAYLDILATLPL